MKAVIGVLILALSGVWTVRAQSGELSEGCRSTLGEKNVKRFLAFDADLRAALSRADPATVSMLVEYPLRVNEAPGSGFAVSDPGALYRHFHQVFPPEIIRAVSDQHASDLMCNQYGIIYGNGELQVHLMKSGFGIAVVNLPEPPAKAKSAPFAPLFVCRTEKHNVLVEQGSGQIVRYRSWDAGHSILGKPDLEIKSGIGKVEGTGWCAHSEWSFRKANATYRVSELGCFPDSNQPPEKSRGQLSVAIDGQKDESWWWCY